MEFRKLTLKEIPLIKPFFVIQKSRICDYSIGGLFMWRDFFYTEYAIEEGILFFKVKYVNNMIAFTIPMAESAENVRRGLDLLCDYAAENNYDTIFCMTSGEDRSVIEDYFSWKGFSVVCRSDRKWADYLYDAESFLEFKGKRMHGQRNHVNKFKSLYPDWSLRRIEENLLPDCIAFLDKITARNTKTDPVAIEELAKTREVLENYAIYDLLGACLYVGERIVGLSIGEIIYDTMIVHIEKGDTDYAGVYQMLSSEFAKCFVTPEVKYINREDDSGDYHLRTSKLSYHPIGILEKFTIWIEQ